MKRLVLLALAALLALAPLFAVAMTERQEKRAADISKELNRYLSPMGDRYGQPLPRELLATMGVQQGAVDTSQDSAAKKEETDWAFWMLMLQECKKDPTPDGLAFKNNADTKSVMIPAFRDAVLTFMSQPENESVYGIEGGVSLLFSYLNIQHALGFGYEELMAHLNQSLGF